MNSTLSSEAVVETKLAITLHATLAATDITTIPVLSNDRCMPRTEQAELARSFFKKLGLKGVSVTTPTYSMARTVHITLPARRDHVFGCNGFPIPGSLTLVENTKARERMEALLL